MKDFLQALAGCLKAQMAEDVPLYFGQVLQGLQRPCLLLLPPKVSRRVLSGGRVQREYEIDLRFYTGGNADMYEQQRIGEKLIYALDELFGRERNYRGRELRYVPGEEYLNVTARYELMTLKSLEQGNDEGLNEALMLEFGFAADVDMAAE